MLGAKQHVTCNSRKILKPTRHGCFFEPNIRLRVVVSWPGNMASSTCPGQLASSRQGHLHPAPGGKWHGWHRGGPREAGNLAAELTKWGVPDADSRWVPRLAAPPLVAEDNKAKGNALACSKRCQHAEGKAFAQKLFGVPPPPCGLGSRL